MVRVRALSCTRFCHRGVRGYRQPNQKIALLRLIAIPSVCLATFGTASICLKFHRKYKGERCIEFNEMKSEMPKYGLCVKMLKLHFCLIRMQRHFQSLGEEV